MINIIRAFSIAPQHKNISSITNKVTLQIYSLIKV
jgi:hypothetical protein